MRPMTSPATSMAAVLGSMRKPEEVTEAPKPYPSLLGVWMNGGMITFCAYIPTPTNSAATLAEGLAVRVPDEAALAIVLKGAARIVTVSETELRSASRAMFNDTRNLAEGAASAPLAAALQERVRLAGRRFSTLPQSTWLCMMRSQLTTASSVPTT